MYRARYPTATTSRPIVLGCLHQARFLRILRRIVCSIGQVQKQFCHLADGQKIFAATHRALPHLAADTLASLDCLTLLSETSSLKPMAARAGTESISRMLLSRMDSQPHLPQHAPCPFRLFCTGGQSLLHRNVTDILGATPGLPASFAAVSVMPLRHSILPAVQQLLRQ